MTVQTLRKNPNDAKCNLHFTSDVVVGECGSAVPQILREDDATV
jgi:hypothetical protein